MKKKVARKSLRRKLIDRYMKHRPAGKARRQLDRVAASRVLKMKQAIAAGINYAISHDYVLSRVDVIQMNRYRRRVGLAEMQVPAGREKVSQVSR